MALFRDLLKKWFYQNSSSAASSDARIPLLTATGEPKGSDTMANLASVLDALPKKGIVRNVNMDTLLEQGQYRIYTAVNLYDGMYNYGTLFVRADSDYIVQQYVDTNGGAFERTSTDGGQSWRTNWRRTDNFGCNTPSDLASVLGATYTNITNGQDLNDLKTAGKYACSSSSIVPNVGNVPSDVVVAFELEVSCFNSSSIHQTLWSFSLNNWLIYCRDFNGSSWGSWQKISTDIPSFYKRYANLTALRTAIGKLEFVDLGLPSGRLWASKNIGAETITDDGYYFSWGNVEGHAANSGYDFSDAVYANTEGSALTSNLTINNDAANFYLGGTCKMPTREDFQELNTNCTNEWVILHGVAGRRFTSRINGNSIFLPASGDYEGTSFVDHGVAGRYRSSSYISASGAYILHFNSSVVTPSGSNSRSYGFTVRAVQ